MPERYRPRPEGDPDGQDKEITPEPEPVVKPEPEIPTDTAEKQRTLPVEVAPEQKTKEAAKERELPEYTPEEIAGALRRHFERMEAYSSEQELDKLLKALMEKLDRHQQEKIKAFLKEKARELQEKTNHLKTTIESMIIIVRAISDTLEKNRK